MLRSDWSDADALTGVCVKVVAETSACIGGIQQNSGKHAAFDRRRCFKEIAGELSGPRIETQKWIQTTRGLLESGDDVVAGCEVERAAIDEELSSCWYGRKRLHDRIRCGCGPRSCRCQIVHNEPVFERGAGKSCLRVNPDQIAECRGGAGFFVNLHRPKRKRSRINIRDLIQRLQIIRGKSTPETLDICGEGARVNG